MSTNPSDLQIAANQANAQKSTGPVTEKGKASSSRNALKHGLTSRDLAVPADQQEEFTLFQQALKDDIHPEGPAEMLLFQQLVSAAWRLLRCDRVEAELFHRTTEVDPLLDPALQPTLRTLSSVRSQALKQQRTATAELRTLQSERYYRLDMMPEIEPNFFGLANVRTLLPKVRNQKHKDADAELKAAIYAPMPSRRHPDDGPREGDDMELEAAQQEILRRLQKTNPKL